MSHKKSARTQSEGFIRNLRHAVCQVRKFILVIGCCYNIKLHKQRNMEINLTNTYMNEVAR
jgi:hypothetical protein